MIILGIAEFDSLYLENENKRYEAKKIWGDVQVSKLRLLKISKWSTEVNDHEFYSNRRNFWHFSSFLIIVYLITQKTNKVKSLIQTPKHRLHRYKDIDKGAFPR